MNPTFLVLTEFPARFMIYPFPAGQETVHDLKLDYVLINQLTALAGLYHFLGATAPSRQHSTRIFHHRKDISCHGDFRQHMELMGRSRMLPVGMEWINRLQAFTNAEDVRISQGSFSIALVSESVPASYPD